VRIGLDDVPVAQAMVILPPLMLVIERDVDPLADTEIVLEAPRFASKFKMTLVYDTEL
jgi:hypothetical protein